MDYGMNGMFKARCTRKKASSASQLVNVAKAARKKIELIKIQKTLRAWAKRGDLVEEKKGYQREHFLF